MDYTLGINTALLGTIYERDAKIEALLQEKQQLMRALHKRNDELKTLRSLHSFHKEEIRELVTSNKAINRKIDAAEKTILPLPTHGCLP